MIKTILIFAGFFPVISMAFSQREMVVSGKVVSFSPTWVIVSSDNGAKSTLPRKIFKTQEPVKINSNVSVSFTDSDLN